ncbi:ABC transporter ATP-binding protein [Microbacterium trichothecenolyticum]|uniref:ABC transporter ATP-binding protein n=1 Tax=Microbacterium trichothecenolyticum TaxID=69370 RepID=UPI0027E343B3|nr:ABC transporter ATP-binding protein [Microbacterium trichothecenolyticum]
MYTSKNEETDVSAQPIVVEISNVSKRFVVRKDNSLKERLVTLGRAGRRHSENFWALREVSATIRAGETVALIGHNGSGKSTLLKLIGGILAPSSGSIDGRGRVAALLELGAGFHPDLTGRENVFLNASVLGLSREETASKFDSIVDFAGIGEFIDTQVKFYSSGMYVRLAFSVAVHTDPDVLIVDEVLAVGDEAFQRKCMDKIRAFQAEGRSIILVTHSMSQVAELCDRAILLDHGKVIADGDTNEAIAAFRELLEDQRLEALREAPPAPEDSSHAQIVRTVVRSSGHRENVVEPGDTLVIETTVSHPTGMEQWLCAFQIDNEGGQVVFGTGSDHATVDPGPLIGERTVRLELPDVRIGGGKYFVSVALYDDVRRRVAVAQQTASFTVPTRPDMWGIVSIPPTFAFIGADSTGTVDGTDR